MAKKTNSKEENKADIKEIFEILDKIVEYLAKIEKDILDWQKHARGGF